ncbi:RNase H-like domain found in reverse transcriptase [Popillia japonica]|uniref:RNase H-like domain found in reverse transcriptase n=1 Tax=Popillia japonica TaxID=7064 RepID=A0AAW1IXU9_POPJA
MPVDDESAMLQAISTHKELKKEISSDKVLIPYTPELPLILATDASPTGLGAVISHVLPDKSERPIAFASRSLTDSEKNYSQIDKESTAIVWGLKKLKGFTGNISYTNTKEHANADYLSRFALHHTKTETLDEEATYYLSQISQIQILPVTRNEIRKETRKDTELTKIINEIQGELPATDQTLTKFTLQDGCLLLQN